MLRRQVDDLLAFSKEVKLQYPAGMPCFVGGQSMGALAALHAVLRDQVTCFGCCMSGFSHSTTAVSTDCTGYQTSGSDGLGAARAGRLGRSDPGHCHHRCGVELAAQVSFPSPSDTMQLPAAGHWWTDPLRKPLLQRARLWAAIEGRVTLVRR